jgi:hypothetical protein
MDHSQHTSDTSDATKWLKRAAIGTALVTGAVVLAPYVLPAVGIGDSLLTEEAMLAMHGSGLGNGLAGTINTALNEVPVIGSTLVSGGFVTAAASMSVSVGGMLLGQYVDKHNDGTSNIRWGRIIATAALATSALIAMPSLLTGISVGLVYLTAVTSGVEAASSMVAAMSSTLGSVSALGMGSVSGAAGAAVALPHMLTCVAPAIPGIISLGMMGSDDTTNPLTSITDIPPPVFDPSIANDGKITIRMEALPEITSGKPCRLRMHLTHSDTGQPVRPEELAAVHGEAIHLFVADQSLRDYHHIHPTPTDTPGVYETSFSPGTSYHYNCWSDIKLKDDQVSRRIKTQLDGQMDRGASAYVVPCSDIMHDGIHAQFESDPPLQQGVTSNVTVSFSDANGNPITNFEPVVGAYIHMVGIGKNGESFMHPHPDGEHHLTPDDRGGPEFGFQITPETSGPMQFYLQVKRDGKESVIPMGQVVKSPSLLSQHVLQSRSNQQLSSQLGL